MTPQWVTIRNQPLGPPANANAPAAPAYACYLDLPFYSLPAWRLDGTPSNYTHCMYCRAALDASEPARMLLGFDGVARVQAGLQCHACCDPYAARSLLYPCIWKAQPTIDYMFRRIRGKYPPPLQFEPNTCVVCERKCTGARLCADPCCSEAFEWMRTNDAAGTLATFPSIGCAQDAAMQWCQQLTSAARSLQHCAPDDDRVLVLDIWGGLAAAVAMCFACGGSVLAKKRCKCHAVATCGAPACMSTLRTSEHMPYCNPWYMAFGQLRV